MSPQDIHALSGAYAVDALDGHERAQFEAHLERCATCREEVASLREAAAHLAATTDTAPPASLRTSVLEGISQVRPLPPRLATDTATPGPATPAAPSRGPRHRRWLPALAAAAAVVAVIGAGAVITQHWQDAPRHSKVRPSPSGCCSPTTPDRRPSGSTTGPRRR